jgi:uncharacterized protein YjbI with pentapeptide repeats
VSDIGLLGASAMQLAYDSEMYVCCGEFFGAFEAHGLIVPHGQFDNATFKDIKFQDSDFTASSFDKASLTDVSFADCNLEGVDFGSAELEEVSFIGCDLSKVSFESASLKRVTITDCIGGMDFADAEITKGIFYETDMGCSSLYNTFITDTVFSRCDLSRCFLSHETKFEDVKISNCDITELSLTLARGGDEVVLFSCTYRPYINITSKTKPLMLPAAGQTTVSYTTRNSSATLYCSSLEEYRVTS